MKKRDRRGMLLLVVLAMLAMFAMVAVAFVVLAGSEKVTAQRMESNEYQRELPQKTLESAVKVIVCGSLQPTSAIKAQSLLEKIYGSSLYSAQIGGNDLGPVIGNSNQLLTLNVPDAMHKVGCTMTMTSGAAAGLTTRIVGLQPGSTTVAHILAFPGGVRPNLGDSYIVNGFPYGGLGFGYGITNGSKIGLITDSNTNLPLAYLPNNQTNWNPGGGANCDYTAPDFQDTLIAYAVPGPNGTVTVPIPSLQRSDLIAYDIAQVPSVATTPGQLQQVMFRPIGTPSTVAASVNPNPNFTGSNPNYNPIWDGVTPNQGQWDVDNMGSGTADSVWVDLGQPVHYTSDGHAYKPLFAILCLDMDGRLNINAHGNAAQSQQGYYAQMAAASYNSGLPGDTTGTTYQGANFAGNAPSTLLPRGQGRGPAEVNLLPLFNGPNTALTFASPYTSGGSFNFTAYQYLFTGYTVNGQPQLGRYGEGVGGANQYFAGISGSFSPLNWNGWFPYGENYWSFMPQGNPTYVWDAYGSPPDTQGFGAVALDEAGRPLKFSMGSVTRNSPYDIDLSPDAAKATGNSTPDSPFSVSELESVLRRFDRDAATLPTRLNAVTLNALRQNHPAEVTTDSFAVPVAETVLPLGSSGLLATQHPVDVILPAMNQDGVAIGQEPSLAQTLLPWETQEGLKMNLNRPFGGGARSQGGNLIYGGQKIEADQPGLQGETVAQYLNATSGTASVTFNYDALGLTTDSLHARQLYAQHLYVLMRYTCDFNALKARLNDSTTNGELAARTIAQWAVNCVAYRDHNEIMIPFSYVVDPVGAGGWQPDNSILHTVWGCKRPALLISETLAFHDRRTQDRTDENVNPAKVALGASPTRTKPGYTSNFPGFVPDKNGDNLDPSFNSKFRPQGSTFVELYNPWPMMEPRTPDLAPSPSSPPLAQNKPGVELTKTTGPNRTGSPVWRLIVVNPAVNPLNGGQLPDPDNPTVAQRPVIERAVYFVPLTGPGMIYPTADGQVKYFPSQTNLPAASSVVVAPSGYAVVGSGDPLNTSNPNRTFIGFENGQTTGNASTDRMVTLNANDVNTGRPVVWGTSDPRVTINPPQVLAIDQATPNGNGAGSSQRFSVSEPPLGYARYEIDPKAGQQVPGPTTGQYQQTLDIPPDAMRDTLLGGPEAGIWSIINTNGTVPAYRIIYLQRLADPTRQYVPESTIAGTPNPANCNPYRTVDAMSVDLTCFNGLTTEVDPSSPKNGSYHFESHQRGETNYLPSGNLEMDIWKQELVTKSQAPATWTIPGKFAGSRPTANMIFSQPLSQSLGYLNRPYSTASGGIPSGQPASSPVGDPPYPFPWLNFPYRPFINEYEILQVPFTSSSQLLMNVNGARTFYGYMDEASQAAGFSIYFNGSTPPTGNNFPHLLNFFDSAAPESAPATWQSGQSPQFHRILAYVGVPTPFAHMSTQIRADLASGNPQAHWFHTPFNGISSYREPGRINLNTISSSDAFMGMANFYPSLANQSTWNKFLASRRGDPNTSNNGMTINAALPSRFMLPFRTPGGASLIPPVGNNVLPAHEVDVTLLRPDPTVTAGPPRPLFEVDNTSMNVAQPLQPTQTPDQFQYASFDFNRNSYFRYQAIQKLGGVTSTQSNVFAIWITVGYFEVTPTTPSASNPDGWQLGEELGSDTGDVVRHRAFYIFDRSIPVGFIRGQDINSDKAFLLKRFIE